MVYPWPPSPPELWVANGSRKHSGGFLPVSSFPCDEIWWRFARVMVIRHFLPSFGAGRESVEKLGEIKFVPLDATGSCHFWRHDVTG